MKGGFTGKLLFIDLTKGTTEEKQLSDDIAKKFLGGYGIGARILYDMMKPGVDPLGPDNIIGFIPGLLNGTGALFGGRYTVVCKSPVTRGWNDANSGGYFGPELKKAGFDAVFVSGCSDKPVYIYIKDGKVEIRDAAKIWGKDSVKTLEALIEDTGEKKLRVAVIGPAGENKSLMACIINDKHRAAGRGGCGAVMGSKNLKALAVRGTMDVPIADRETFKKINSEIAATIKSSPMKDMFGNFGTGSMTGGSTLSGDTPVKNWSGVGAIDMGEESANKLSSTAFDTKYKTKKYACANCPLGCGANYSVNDGKWPVVETDRPEYETLGAFGPMMLNDDIESIIKCNDICNKYGFDTISMGATIAWAMECYENGLITKDDTDGIELTWGNSEAIVAMTQAIADQKGFGKILALGSEATAKKIGKGSEFLVTSRGIELPMHDSRLSPGFARTYQYDPTPGRHVKGGTGMREMMAPVEVRYNYENKGANDVNQTFESEVQNSAGLCLFSGFGSPPDSMPRFISAATGWEFSMQDISAAGKRIFNMRHVFNLREGLDPKEEVLSKRAYGDPPLKEGPLKDVTIDRETLIDQFCDHADWNKDTFYPTKESLEELGGMDDVIEDLYK